MIIRLAARLLSPSQIKSTMQSFNSPSILFVTGAFTSHSCWDEWRIYFESRGFKTVAPPWPNKDAPAEQLRNSHPNSAIASNRLTALIDYYGAIAKQMDECPIVIGHSIGGLITQLLLQRDLAAMGISIHSVAPQGVITFNPSFLRAGWHALGLFTSLKDSYLMSFSTWKYAFTNGMSFDEQKTSYYKYAIPESKLVVRDTLTKAANIDFSKPHRPLLFIAGSIDHSIPASLNYSNYKKYSHSGSITEFKELSGRNHLVLGQPSRVETMDCVHGWISKHL